MSETGSSFAFQAESSFLEVIALRQENAELHCSIRRRGDCVLSASSESASPLGDEFLGTEAKHSDFLHHSDDDSVSSEEAECVSSKSSKECHIIAFARLVFKLKICLTFPCKQSRARCL